MNWLCIYYIYIKCCFKEQTLSKQVPHFQIILTVLIMSVKTIIALFMSNLWKVLWKVPLSLPRLTRSTSLFGYRKYKLRWMIGWVQYSTALYWHHVHGIGNKAYLTNDLITIEVKHNSPVFYHFILTNYCFIPLSFDKFSNTRKLRKVAREAK